MPYITRENRKNFDAEIEAVPIPATAGELNYILTRLVHRFIAANRKRYSTFNEAVGALECAKLELYRKHIGVYEDLKIYENGDVNDIDPV